MQTIFCIHCKKPIEISQAIADQMSEEEKRYREEEMAKAIEESRKRTELLLREELELKEKNYENQLREDKDRIERLMHDILKANEDMRELRKKDEERELENQKKLQEEREKLKDEITKRETDRIQLILAEKDKQMEDMKKALDEARRKSEQGSQQLQGEVLELELEDMLRTTFPQDIIEPVGKGITGADIKHIVKTPLGNTCGVILWEFKRTKHWEDKWIGKLKDDLRAEKANIPVIVSQMLPKEAQNGMGLKDKVWICNFTLILPLAELLRSNLYDVARQKALHSNSTEKAELVYQYLTSHEFQQQIESTIETYRSMKDQLEKEKLVFQKQWKLREEQIDKVLANTANVIGALQGKIGTSMPQIRGLDILELGDGTEN